jgi:hypothetical protein
MRVIKFEGEFCITADHLSGESLEPSKIEALKREGYNKYFRLYDDDGTLYYSGYAHVDLEGEDEFAPLDWAMYDSGCTEIKYRNAQGILETL